MTSVALISCDHGFGHVRRCVLIARALVARGAAVTLFAPTERVARFLVPHEAGVDGVVVRELHTGTTVTALRDPDAPVESWLMRLPSLDKFDVVLSDNLVEILALRGDAVLSGSFFWHHVLDGMPPARKEAAERLLRTHHPRMLAPELFAMPDLASCTRLELVGICAPDHRPQHPGEELLIACGGSAEMEEPFRELIAEVASGTRPVYPMVWVEPRLLPKTAPSWMRPARFDSELYNRLAATVCRAGVGTLTDSLWASARVFAAFEPGNAEPAFNARRIAERGLGEIAASPREAFAAAAAYGRDRRARDAHLEVARGVALDGAHDIADRLL
jgi:UDP:flavonoid glycosyltransferase YjiC (YdhE family)